MFNVEVAVQGNINSNTFEVAVMQSSKEKFSKGLPYRLVDLPDMFRFTQKVTKQGTPLSLNFMLEGSKKCFPDKKILHPRYNWLYGK